MSKHPYLPAALFDSAQANYLEQLDDQAFWHYATELAHTHMFPSESAEEYLACSFEPGRYMLPLASLREVAPLPQQLSTLPFSPAWLAGLALWRNKIIAVVDLAAYLTQQRSAAEANYMIIATINETTIGLLVTIVDTSQTLPEQTLQLSEPEQLTRLPGCPAAVLGVCGDIFILDMPTLLINLLRQIQVTTHE